MARTLDSMPAEQQGFPRFLWRVTAAHTATYFIAGIFAMNVFDYASWWSTPWMDHYRPMDSPLVAAGAGLQVVRGGLFAVALYPLRGLLLDDATPWLLRALRLWMLLVVVGIVAPHAQTRAEQETENEANRLREQVDAALAAVAARAPDEIESLATAADRIERAARDLADALRQIAQQRRTPDLP